MSVDIAGSRARLAEAAKRIVPEDVQVYASALDGIQAGKAVVLGMPSWRPGPTSCLNSYEFPVAVIVSRNGISDTTTVDELDELWPVVLDGLLSLRDQDASLDIPRAEFGLFPIRGDSLPAQILTCTFTS